MNKDIIVIGKVDKTFISDFNHYIPNKNYSHLKFLDIFKVISKKYVVIQTSSSKYFPLYLLRRFGFKFYNMDRASYSEEPWEWHRLINDLGEVNFDDLRSYSREKLCKLLSKLKDKKLKKTYIFGTGPSLKNAIHREWKDGYRIVCNTIVKDRRLWNHLQPNFIVAGDALFHFSNTDYANKFRLDLEKRLSETRTYFIYPETFHNYLLSKINEKLLYKLIPIPGSDKEEITSDLCNDFRLPGNENVLGLLLLPLACNLSKNVYLWGFDGRSPNDKGFWKNSSLHSYKEMMMSLKKHSPAFFNANIPASKESTYADRVQGEDLDKVLEIAENIGYNFTMMHTTWSKALIKRYNK